MKFEPKNTKETHLAPGWHTKTPRGGSDENFSNSKCARYDAHQLSHDSRQKWFSFIKQLWSFSTFDPWGTWKVPPGEPNKFFSKFWNDGHMKYQEGYPDVKFHEAAMYGLWAMTCNGHTDGLTDWRTDGRTDGRTELDVEVHSHLKKLFYINEYLD